MNFCKKFEIHVVGMSSHGSAPHLGHDAVTAAASIVMNLQMYMSRVNNPLVPLTLTVNKVRGGSRFNIIAGDTTLTGIVRTASEAAIEHAEEEIKRIAVNTALALGCEAEVTVTNAEKEDVL